jgi:hypothetical protein
MKIFLVLAFLATPIYAQQLMPAIPANAPPSLQAVVPSCYGCGTAADVTSSTTGGGTRQYNNALERIEAVTPPVIQQLDTPRVRTTCVSYPAVPGYQAAYTFCQ